MYESCYRGSVGDNLVLDYYEVERLNIKILIIELLFGSAKFPDDNCQIDDGKGLMMQTTSTVRLSIMSKLFHLSNVCDFSLQVMKFRSLGNINLM